MFQFSVEPVKYPLYLGIAEALKAQLILAVKPIFYDELCDATIGYANICTLTILDPGASPPDLRGNPV